MRELKRSIFGYDRYDVDDVILLLQEENEKLQQEVLRQKEQIEQLQTQLRKFRSEEDLIREAIVDAKQLSKRLVMEAKEQATEMLFDAEKTISDQFTQFDSTMSTLNGLKDKVVAQKAELTKELQDTLVRYQSALRESETEEFNSIKEDIEANIERTENLVETSKQVILLPNFNADKGKLAVEVGNTQDKGYADIPIYSLT